MQANNQAAPESGLSTREPSISDPKRQSSSSLGSSTGAFKPSWRLYTVFLTLCIVTLVAALDATSLSVALPIMAKALNGTAIEAFWAGTSFLLASTVLQPVFGNFSDIFGRKPMILVGLTFFTVGAIICALAQNFTVILVGRTIQGVGGGAIIVLTEIIVADLVPLRLRGKYFGFISSMWALGSVTGPVIGGAFAQEVSWKWIFWINLPFCGIAFVMIPIFLKLNFIPSSMRQKLARVDWVGTAVFIASATSLMIPISWGGINYPWDSFRTLVPLFLGAAGIVGFILYEIFVATDPVIRMNIFKQRSAAANYVGTVMHGIILWCLLYYLPLYFEAVKHQSPIMAGVSVFPQTFTVAPASVVVGILVSKNGHFRRFLYIGWVLTVLGLGLMYLLDVSTPTVSWVFINLVAGLGTGALFPAMAFAIQASASDEDTAYAISLFTFFRGFGQTLGVAIGGTIFTNALKNKIASFPGLAELAGEYSADAVALVEVIKVMPAGQQRDDLIWSYAAALKIVWISMLGFAVVGLVASLFTEPLTLDRELNTNQGLREEKKGDVETN